MDLLQTLRSTAAVREFTDDPVDDATLARVLDTARFAPSGGNAQAWHVVIVRDPGLRTALRDLYLPGWRDYLAMSAAGLRPWAPVNDRAAEAAAVAATPEHVAAASAARSANTASSTGTRSSPAAKPWPRWPPSTATWTGTPSPAGRRCTRSSGACCWPPGPRASAGC